MLTASWTITLNNKFIRSYPWLRNILRVMLLTVVYGPLLDGTQIANLQWMSVEGLPKNTLIFQRFPTFRLTEKYGQVIQKLLRR